METNGNIMEIENLNKTIKKNIDSNDDAIQIDKLRERMAWTKKDLYEILLEKYKEDKEKPDSLDGYRKQIYNDGSTKYLKEYFKYLYNLPEVQEKLIKKPKNSYKTFLASLIIMIMLGFATIYFTFIDDTFNKMKKMQTIEYKQCMKKCLPL